MKKIKDLLNEFRRDGERNNNNNNNSGGNDPFSRLKQFMEKTPFSHITTGEHELHFKSSHHAAEAVAESLAKHEMGRVHANKSGNVPMHEYFLSSAGTHDDVLNAISNHIANHPNLPSDLIDHVPMYISHLEAQAEKTMATVQGIGSLLAPKGAASSIGEGQFKKHHHPDADTLGVHPHLYDDAHHLTNVIDEIKSNTDHGYFLRKDEYKQ